MTLGKREQTYAASPQQLATHSRLDSLQAQLAAVSTVRAQAPPTGTAVEDMFLRGVELALQHNEERANTAYKRFTKAQKASICGFCVATNWSKVPKIWKDIEATRTEVELMDILKRAWDPYKRDINLSFTDITWEEDLLASIHIANFASTLEP